MCIITQSWIQLKNRNDKIIMNLSIISQKSKTKYKYIFGYHYLVYEQILVILNDKPIL